MTIEEMFSQSAMLAVLGMAVVFSFLTLMIICVTVTGKILRALGLSKEPAPIARKTAADSGTSSDVIAAIGAAVSEYRK